MITTIWYPPAVWPPNEIIVTETLPQLLPDTFHLGIAVGPAHSFDVPSQRLPITDHADQNVHLHLGHWAQLATFKRQGTFLSHLPPTLSSQPLTKVEAQFGPSIQLTGFWLDTPDLHPGSTFSILLEWVAIPSPPTDYTVFIHLLAPDGTLVAQDDAYPNWLTPQPTSQWPTHRPLFDRHTLNLPPDLSPATYTIQIGLYDAQTLERLSLPDGSNTFQLTQIRVVD
jgi:hypothetical protein